MKQQSHLGKGVEQVVSGFFETGQDEDKLHTLHLAGAVSPADEPAIESALFAISGVEKVHVDAEKSNVYVLCEGPTEPLVEALHQADFEITTAH